MSPDEPPSNFKVAHDRDVDRGTQAYVWYIVGVMALFGFLILMAYLAWTNGWIPQR